MSEDPPGGVWIHWGRPSPSIRLQILFFLEAGVGRKKKFVVSRTHRPVRVPLASQATQLQVVQTTMSLSSIPFVM